MSGIITKISGPTVVARGMAQTQMFNRVAVGRLGLLGEVIRVRRDEATIQVYEETSGLALDEEVSDAGEPLLVELGPGLLGSVFDGVQRPLDAIAAEQGDWITRGVKLPALPRDRQWPFTPMVRPGTAVIPGVCLGLIQETEKIQHRVLVPPAVSGTVREIREGTFTVTDTIAVLDGDRPLTMVQRWPVRTPRPAAERLPPVVPFVTGQRVFDMLFPVASGGTVIAPGGFGTGKCLPGDVPVLMADGTLRPLAELYEVYSAKGRTEQRGEESLIHINPGFRVMSYDGHSFTPRVCTSLYCGVSDLLHRVRTRSGREYRVTPQHPLLTVSPELELRYVPAQALREGDYLAVPRKMTLSVGPQKLDYDSMLDEARVCDEHVLKELPKLLTKLLETRRGTLKALAREIGVNYVTLRGYAKGRNLPPVGVVKQLYRLAACPFILRQVKGERDSHGLWLPELVDGDLAEFLALVLADGGMKPSGVEFYNNDEDLLERFDAIAWRLFGLKGKRGMANTVRCSRLYSRILVQILVQWGVPASGKAKARTCHIPVIIMRSPDEVIARFLGGYFLCDGHFGDREIEFSTASRRMQSGLSYLLTRLGILHQWREKRVNGKTYYRLTIRSKAEVERFYETCSGALARFPKFATMASYLSEGKRGYTATDIVPPFPHLFREVYDRLGRPHTALEQRGVNVSNYIDGRLRMTAATFRLFAEFAREPRLIVFAEALKHLYCDPIVAIERVPGPHVVYDLTVPKVHNFVGGEMPTLLHNTVVEQTLAKYARADIIIYIGCGERGNEMTEVLTDFPHLKDPATGLPLMQRTVLVINTSNMPVAARETSIYTGITLAEYYRDMGYEVALMADSTSRWAEATREISARLEEMPGEEGYPTYLATKLAGFYERGGRVQCLGDPARQGSVTIVSAISPPGGDFSEPVTQSSMQVAGALWALDADLAHRRHFPAINWKRSFSLYAGQLDPWFKEQVAPDWPQLRAELVALLQKEEELQEIVQLVGIDSLQDQERIVLEVSRLIREEYLRQNAFSEIDASCPLEKQYWMLKALLQFLAYCRELLKRGRPIEQLVGSPFRTELERLKETPPALCLEQAQAMIEKMTQELGK